MKTKLAVLLVLLAMGGSLFAQSPLTIEGTTNGLTQHWSSGAAVNRGQIVKLNSSSQVIPMATTDTSGALGVAVTTVNASGADLIVSLAGTPLIQMDGTCTAGNIVSPSSTFAGLGHCAASASGQTIGVAISASSPGSSFWNVQLSPLSSASVAGGIPTVTSNPATCTIGQTFFNTTTSQFLLCIATNTLSTAAGSPATTIDVTLFGVKANVKACFDGTVTSGSPNISSAGQCNWTSADVGKKIFVTNMCSATVCGYAIATSSTTILPTQLTVARIASVTDATHVVADCTAPANCASPNATSTPTANTAVVVYGDDDTAALNAAWLAAVNQPRCATLLLPNGMMFFNAALFQTKGTTGACQSADNIHSLSQIWANGLTVMGFGPNNSVLVPTPDFNWSGAPNTCCAVGNSSNGASNGAQATQWQNFAVVGFGQSLSGATLPATLSLFSLAGGSGGGQMNNVILTAWGNRNGNTPNGLVMAQYSFVANSIIDNFGAWGVSTGALGVMQFVNNHVGSGGFGCLVQAGGYLIASNNFWDGPTQGGSCLDITGTFIDNSSHIGEFNVSTTGTNIIVRSGGIYDGTNVLDAGGVTAVIPLNILAGGTARLKGYRQTVSHTTAVQNAGTLLDLGGNTFNGAVVNTASTATYRADGHNVMGACTGVATASQTLGLFGTGPNVTLTTCTSTTIGSGIVMQAAGTLQNLTVTATAGGVNASSGVVTVLKNGTGTTITCTMGTGTFCNDSTHTAAYVAGDLISINFTTQAAETLAGVKAYVIEY